MQSSGLVNPNEPARELSIDEQRCSTQAVTDAGCDVGMLRDSHEPVRWRFSRQLTKYKCINKRITRPASCFSVPTGAMVTVDYNNQWNFHADRKP